jgi:hypothetical protein
MRTKGMSFLGGKTAEKTILLDGELAGLACRESFQECCGHVAFLKIGIIEDPTVKRDGCLDTLDDKLTERAFHTSR